LYPNFLVKAAVISTLSSLPTSRPWKYVAGVKNCYADSLTTSLTGRKPKVEG